MNNPLLDFSDVPRFDSITPAHVAPALDVLLTRANHALEQVCAPDFAARWDALSATLDVATEHLGRAWGVVSHLNSVADTPELRAAYNEALPRITEFWTRLGADERLYAKYQAIERSTLNAEQQQALKNTLRSFMLSGAQLHGAAKVRFAQIQERQAELGQKFSENTLDATNAFSYYASEDEIAGLPEDVVQASRAAAQADAQAGRYKLTLHLPCYLPVMQFAHSSALREKLYRAYVTRASDLASDSAAQSLDNSALITEILALRHEEAQLLGYADFAELSLVPKMAQSPLQVIAFLRDVARRARPYAEKDVHDLRQFAAQHLQLNDPQPWDWAYISEKLKEARYAFSEQEVRQYFTAPKVLAGLFKIVETLFEVHIRLDHASTWHPSVQLYRIERNGQLIGQFYLDQPARSGKRGGAWMDDARTRWLRPDTQQLQTPVAYLVCNFADGVDGKPALLAHDDVITLFHEFGHGLHHLLTQVNERDVSGIGGVEWDAVELPSQFMENFCWQWPVLRDMTAHIDTGMPLPRALYDKMVAAKNFQSGMQTLRQMEYSLFDMLLHTAQEHTRNYLELLTQVRQEVAVIQAPDFHRMPHTFSHIFAGGYAAGYYSYKWAEVLSADAYSAFEEHFENTTSDTSDDTSHASTQTGRRFRQEILEVGGSRPAMDSFVAFRGREPTLDALLRHQGMMDSTDSTDSTDKSTNT